MDVVMSLLERLGQAAVGLLLNPFYYISILIVLLQMRKMIFFERKLYHSRLHSLLGASGRIVLWGMLVGAVGSLVMGVVGSSLPYGALLYVWAIALLLAVVRIRFLCLAYAVGIIGVVHTALSWMPGIDRESEWYAWIRPLEELHMPSLLVLVGVLHLMEALLVRVQGAHLATPMFVEGKRGKLIGSYQFQGLWPVPLFLLVPASGGEALPFTPLLGGADLWQSGWMLLALPAMIGFTDSTVSLTPQQKSVRTSKQLLLYGMVITGFGMLTEWLPFMVLPAALLTMLLHELLIWFAAWDEKNRSPIYIHTERGLTVLAVLPNSAAQALGIRPGEVIRQVNGQAVRTKEELHAALRRNSAFTRLEMVDQAGEQRFVQRALFEGDHHQLGIILAPDDDAEFYVVPYKISRFRMLRSALDKHRDRTFPG